jgi:hypothetical protein
MKNIINSSERTHAYLLFLGMFLFTMAVIVVAVYLNTQLPRKENDSLRKRVADLEEEIFEQKGYLEHLQAVKSRIDSLYKMEEVDPFIEKEIIDILFELRLSMGDQREVYGEYNALVYDLAKEMHGINKKVINYQKEFSRAEETQRQFERTRQELIEANRDLEQCRRSNNMAAR